MKSKVEQPKDIRNLTYEELVEYLKAAGEKTFRADQIFDWIYKKGVQSFDQMKNLSSPLKEKLKTDFVFADQQVVREDKAPDGTNKFLFDLYDHEKVESVLIPAEDRATLCISTQAGCKFRCGFCASGIGGWSRNLTAAEIISQALYAKKVSEPNPLSHIVFMGTGEPLDNYDNVIKAIRLLNSDKAFNIAARRITVSTCGLIPEIKKLADEGLQIELAVSLHGSSDESRNVLMPVNKKYPIKELIEACRAYIAKTNRQITFEYILIRNVTCTDKAAKELGVLLKGMNCKLNLIPYNKVSEFDHEPPTKLEMLAFKSKLSELGIHSTVRMPRGRDVAAACGQLRHQYSEKNSVK